VIKFSREASNRRTPLWGGVPSLFFLRQRRLYPLPRFLKKFWGGTPYISFCGTPPSLFGRDFYILLFSKREPAEERKKTAKGKNRVGGRKKISLKPGFSKGGVNLFGGAKPSELKESETMGS